MLVAGSKVEGGRYIFTQAWSRLDGPEEACRCKEADVCAGVRSDCRIRGIGGVLLHYGRYRHPLDADFMTYRGEDKRQNRLSLLSCRQGHLSKLNRMVCYSDSFAFGQRCYENQMNSLYHNIIYLILGHRLSARGAIDVSKPLIHSQACFLPLRIRAFPMFSLSANLSLSSNIVAPALQVPPDRVFRVYQHRSCVPVPQRCLSLP